MMKTEKRVRSISFTGSSTKSAPLLTRPILLHGEAETLLRKVERRTVAAKYDIAINNAKEGQF